MDETIEAKIEREQEQLNQAIAEFAVRARRVRQCYLSSHSSVQPNDTQLKEMGVVCAEIMGDVIAESIGR